MQLLGVGSVKALGISKARGEAEGGSVCAAQPSHALQSTENTIPAPLETEFLRRHPRERAELPGAVSRCQLPVTVPPAAPRARSLPPLLPSLPALSASAPPDT